MDKLEKIYFLLFKTTIVDLKPLFFFVNFQNIIFCKHLKKLNIIEIFLF